MLAAYLRQQAPIRYAAQDALTNLRLAMALRNFLHVSTRAHDLPHYADLGRAQQIHPAMGGLLADIFGRHDPRAIPFATDILEEHAGQTSPHHEGFIFADNADPVKTLNDYLHMLHAVTSGQSAYLPHHQIAGRYGQLHTPASVFSDSHDTEEQAERKYNLGQAVRNTVDPHESAIYDLMRSFVRTPHFDALREGRTGAMGGRPMSLLHLYDALRQASLEHHDPQAADLRQGLATSMRTTLLPTLHEGL